MSDTFKAIADPKARLVLETLADKPGSTIAKLVPATALKSEQIATILATLVEVELIKSTGSGASKKYTLNAKGFSPYVAWLAKVAETQAVASLELQLLDIGDRVGKVIADGSDWIAERVKENVKVDPKKLAKDLGRSVADLKRDVKKETLKVQKEAKTVVSKVKKSVKR